MQEHFQALILFSHGSLLCGAGETLRAHAERIRKDPANPYCAVEIGYLNYSDPPFEDAVDRCLQAGAKEIVVVPYFLVAGKFVKSDLPPRVHESRKTYPEIGFVLADPILDAPGMEEAICEMSEAARPPERWRDDLNAAPRFCEGRPECPLYATPNCPKGGGALAGNKETGFTKPASAAQKSDPSSTGGSTSLLVMVHGSPRPESNDDVYRVVEAVRGLGRFDLCHVGFMECNDPNIPASIDSLVARGMNRVVAVPYFLHTGKHVADDLPGLLEDARDRHPHVDFLMSSYVGLSPRVTQILQRRAQEVLKQVHREVGS